MSPMVKPDAKRLLKGPLKMELTPTIIVHKTQSVVTRLLVKRLAASAPVCV